MISLYHSTGGDSWTTVTGWNEGPVLDDGFNDDPCAEPLWYGVTCEGSRVTEVSLDSNLLTGNLPPELGDLAELVVLNLESNLLEGTIPAELGSLGKLQKLQLGFNDLSGPIPEVITNLTELTHLELNSNSLEGDLPTQMGSLANLTRLELGFNRLTGDIPASIGNSTELDFLSLNNNSLTGFIPSELGQLSRLVFLRLANNSLIGPIPDSFGTLTSLRELTLDHNQLSGPIPLEFGNLASLVRAELSSNRLSGSIPASLGNLNPAFLYLSDNLLSGTVPAGLAQLDEGVLDLRGNQLDSVENGLVDELNRAQRGPTPWDSLQNLVGVYPQLAMGGGIRVILLLSNGSDSDWQGRAYLDGGLWPSNRVWTLNDHNRTGESSFEVALQAGTTQKFILESSSRTPVTGWLSVRSVADSSPDDVTASFFFNFSDKSGLFDSTGVAPSEFAEEFRFPVESSPTVSTGIAIRSVAERTVLFLYDSKGFLIDRAQLETDEVGLLAELFEDLPEEFIGYVRTFSLAVRLPHYVTVMRIEEAGEGGIRLTSIPAKPYP